MNLANPKPICNLPTSEAAKTDSAPVRMVRRLIQKVSPTPARVRYDADKDLWAVLNDQNEPIRHFQHGYLTGVTFSVITTKEPMGCGPLRNKSIGIAEGLLRENVYSPNTTGSKNLMFNQAFLDNNLTPIVFAKQVQLMPNRRATYIA